MNSKQERALNGELAKWAGFRFHLSASENPHYWVDPEGHACADIPDFTKSLDACFTWLVPKLYSYSLHSSSLYAEDGKLVMHRASAQRRVGDVIYSSGYVDAESPSMALCLAIKER